MSVFGDSVSNKRSYEDYKYVMQDRSAYSFGARLTYAECLDDSDVPFKFRAIIEHYILKDDIDPNTSLESHLYYMNGEEFSARTYIELKARVRVWMKQPVKGLFGRKTKMEFKESVIPLSELFGMDTDTKKINELKIGELILPKLALMGFSV